MKAVILAGGPGSRLSEETDLRPKPMVEVGGFPLLWHIMKIYSAHGINDFIICAGYKGEVIKNYFINYYSMTSDVRCDLRAGTVTYMNGRPEPWMVTVADTGQDTMTGGRLKRVLPYVGNETFCLTYGDGLSNADITAEIAYHKKEGRRATVLAVRPDSRFGALRDADKGYVSAFEEKPTNEVNFINGGFFVLEPSVGDYIEGDAMSFEREPLAALAAEGELSAFQHKGFWQPCDTLRDKRVLDDLWGSGKAPWRIW